MDTLVFFLVAIAVLSGLATLGEALVQRGAGEGQVFDFLGLDIPDGDE